MPFEFSARATQRPKSLNPDSLRDRKEKGKGRAGSGRPCPKGNSGRPFQNDQPRNESIAGVNSPGVDLPKQRYRVSSHSRATMSSSVSRRATRLARPSSQYTWAARPIET